jgi:hypothetical protein
MPVILATWEAENRRIAIQDQLGQKVSKTPSQLIAMLSWHCPEIKAI